MNSELDRLGPIHTQWDDYTGTAAADDADALAGTRSLYAIAGLDRERWTIASIDFSRWGSSHLVTVYAVDRIDLQVDSAAGPEAGVDLPVTAFRLTGSAEVEAFMMEAFKRISVRLTSSALVGHRLVVQGRAELASTAEPV